ncbi:hypothetical protein [Erwinia phage vB_Ea277G]|nr:hypothetical protein [Erwinia phage vB_Ea277G]
MDKRKICLDLADVLEKELYTQAEWEERLSTVWLRLKDDATLELCERLVEHVIETNAPKIDISALPQTVSGFREITRVVKDWSLDLQHKYDSRELDATIGLVQSMVQDMVNSALSSEASHATEVFYGTRVQKAFNQFCLDHKVYSIYPELRQTVVNGYYPHNFAAGNRWRFGGPFGYGAVDVDSRVYINSRLHQTLTALRDADNPMFSEEAE